MTESELNLTREDIENISRKLTQVLLEHIPKIISVLSQAVSSMVASINSVITGAVSTIIQSISNFAGIVASAVGKISSLIQDLASTIVISLSNLFSSFAYAITDRIQALAAGLYAAITGVGGIIPTAIGMLQDMAAKIGAGFMMITQALTGFINGILVAGQYIAETILRSVDTFMRSIPAWFINVMESIANFFNTIIGEAREFVSGQRTWFTNNLLKPFWELIPKPIMDAIEAIKKFFDDLAKAIADFFKDPLAWFKTNLVKPLIDGFDSLVKWIWANIPDWLKDAFQRISDFFTKDLVNFFTKDLANFFTKDIPGFIQWLKDNFSPLIKDPVNLLIHGIVNPILDGLNQIGQWIWNALPDWFKAALTSAQDFFTKGFQDFLNWLKDNFGPLIKDPVKVLTHGIVNPILDGLNQIGQWIWNALPDWFKAALERIRDFFTKDLVNFFTKDIPAFFEWLKGSIDEFFKDPLGWLQKNLVDPIWNALKKFGEWLWSILPDWFKNALTAVYDFFSGIVKGLQEFINDPLGFLKKHASSMADKPIIPF